jgi:hypothetical protein
MTVILLIIALFGGQTVGTIAKNFDVKSCQHFGRGVVCQPKK